jgi:hypothetical protein
VAADRAVCGQNLTITAIEAAGRSVVGAESPILRFGGPSADYARVKLKSGGTCPTP